MKKIIIALAVAIFLFSCSETSVVSGKKAEVKNAEDSLSYCLGLSIANFAQSLNAEINPAVLEKALNDKMNDEELLFQEEQINMIMQIVQQKLYTELSEKMIKEGEEFLENNKTKSGINVTESGLQYEILKEGNGPKPIDGDKVSVHYIGTMIDGTQFDSSFERGQPIEFPVNQVIPGWTEALKLMPLGSKWKVYIPSDLGYGARPPQGSNIKPNAVLIFEVELLDIIPAEDK